MHIVENFIELANENDPILLMSTLNVVITMDKVANSYEIVFYQ